MKTFFPQSLFARLFICVVALVLLSNSVWFFLAYHYAAKPRAQETAALAASMVNLVRASLYAAAPEKRTFLLAELSRREGIFLHPCNEQNDDAQDLPNNLFTDLVKAETRALLGNNTRFASSVDGFEGFWVSFKFSPDDEDEYWLEFPRERAPLTITMHWLIWGASATLITLLATWFMARQISWPLKNLAQNARALGKGEQFLQINTHQGSKEIQALARDFERMKEDLSAHEKERALVLAGISHDLRTPLTRLRLEAELSVDNPQSRDNIVLDIEQMEAIIAQFMDYAKSDVAEELVFTQAFELFHALGTRQQELHVDFSFAIDENLPLMPLRAKSLCRAVINLIDNAYKYGKPPVILNITQHNQTMHIDVIDHGQGVPKTEFSRIKRAFVRGDSARTNTTGTGLGLAIVERIVRQHSGEIQFEHLKNAFLVRLMLPIRSL